MAKLNTVKRAAKGDAMTTRKRAMSRPVDGLVRLVSVGWQATYACGCSSGVVKRKRDMALRCDKHGETVRTILHDVWMPNAGFTGLRKPSTTRKDRHNDRR